MLNKHIDDNSMPFLKVHIRLNTVTVVIDRSCSKLLYCKHIVLYTHFIYSRFLVYKTREIVYFSNIPVYLCLYLKMSTYIFGLYIYIEIYSIWYIIVYSITDNNYYINCIFSKRLVQLVTKWNVIFSSRQSLLSFSNIVFSS